MNNHYHKKEEKYCKACIFNEQPIVLQYNENNYIQFDDIMKNNTNFNQVYIYNCNLNCYDLIPLNCKLREYLLNKVGVELKTNMNNFINNNDEKKENNSDK